jgi:hypothetical protein
MNNQSIQQLVIIALIVAVGFLGYLQYGAMQREAKIYETVEILQMHVDSLDGLNHIQQLQIDSLKKNSLPTMMDEASATVSEGLGKFLESVETQIADIRKQLGEES